MTAIDDTPINKNFLSPLNFRFQIKKAPYLNFFIQKVNIPSLSIQDVPVSNPFVKIPYSGDHIDYGSFNVTFKIDEDFKNYFEIHNWLRGLGFPESFKEYNDLAEGNKLEGNGLESDISLIILNSKRMANYEVTFRDCFPISLSEVDFDTTDSNVNFVQATCEFKYTLFSIEKIS
jgi:hypothetical protein